MVPSIVTCEEQHELDRLYRRTGGHRNIYFRILGAALN